MIIALVKRGLRWLVIAIDKTTGREYIKSKHFRFSKALERQVLEIKTYKVLNSKDFSK